MQCKLVFSAVLSAAMLLAQPGPMHGGGMGGPMHGGGTMLPLGPGSTVTGAPYSATETMQVQQTLAGGNQIQRSNESKVYRDSQGRVRIEHTFTPPAGASSQAARTMITIFDPVAGSVYHLDPDSKTVRQMPSSNRFGAGANQGMRGPFHSANSNTQTEDLGTQTINGVSATGTRTTMTIPAGAIGNTQPIQVVRETWTSTDLKVPVLIKTSDPRFGNTTMQLTNIVRGEPDPSLFQIPAGYTTVSGPGGFGGNGGGMMPHMGRGR